MPRVMTEIPNFNLCEYRLDYNGNVEMVNVFFYPPKCQDNKRYLLTDYTDQLSTSEILTRKWAVTPDGEAICFEATIEPDAHNDPPVVVTL